MFCSKCGREIMEGTKFCAGCGTPVVEVVKAVPQPEEKQEPVQQPEAEKEPAQPQPEIIQGPMEQPVSAEEVKKPNIISKITKTEAGILPLIMLIAAAAAISLEMMISLFGSGSFLGMLENFGMSMCGYITSLIVPAVLVLHINGNIKLPNTKKLILVPIIMLAVQGTAALISLILYLENGYATMFHWVNGSYVLIDLVSMFEWGSFRNFVGMLASISFIGKNVFTLLTVMKLNKQ